MKRILRSLIIVIISIAITLFLLVNSYWFFVLEPIPNNIQITNTINDRNSNYIVYMYYDERSNLYWITSTDKNTGKEDLVLRDSDVKGLIKLRVSGINSIDCIYEYDKSYMYALPDKTISLNLATNDTYKISIFRNIIQYFF
jgi:hypothetical protein